MSRLSSPLSHCHPWRNILQKSLVSRRLLCSSNNLFNCSESIPWKTILTDSSISHVAEKALGVLQTHAIEEAEFEKSRLDMESNLDAAKNRSYDTDTHKDSALESHVQSLEKLKDAWASRLTKLQKEFLSLDELVSYKAEEVRVSIKKEADAKSVVRIKIYHDQPELGFPKSIRNLQPMFLYSELHNKFQLAFSAFIISFSLKGKDDIVGSDDELRFAYMDSDDGLLELDLKLISKNLKRKASAEKFSDAASDEDSIAVSITAPFNNRWSHAEEALFKEGLQLFGWGHWASIATIVKTRSSEGVRAFSRTAKGSLSIDIRANLPNFICCSDSLRSTCEWN